MKKTFYLNNLTWPEVQNHIDNGCKIAILPFGHTEQHGPHLPFGTDTYLISEVTKRGVALAIQETDKPIALLCPTIPFGNGGRFANGELRLRPSTFIAVFTDLIKELEEQGFTKVVIVSGHGSNEAVMGNSLNEAYWNGSKVEGYTVSPFSFIRTEIAKILESEDYGHACEVETSMMLYLFPELVQMDKIRNDHEQPEFWTQNETVDAVKQQIVHHFWSHARQVTMDKMPGYVGRPRFASREKGRKLVHAWIRGFADFLIDLDKKGT